MTEPAEDPQFWRHLLTVRREVTWGNFFWFSPKTLLMSLNDQIAKSIEEVDENGSIVDRRRMRWMAEQRNRPDWPGLVPPLRILDSQGFVALGDTGEMDASQYMLVHDLWLHEAALRKAGVRTVLLMSDVVYPAGDINQWADAVYLPYFGRPVRAWSTAVDAWQGRSLDAPFGKEWNVLAMPGNHDWYDGLNGFMYHAAGAEPLGEVAYDDTDLTVRQRLAQRWWRNPAAPKRELVQKVRSEVDRPPRPSMPGLPGPYYAVDLGCRDSEAADHTHQPDGGCRPVMRLIMVDTGITGSVDEEQAAWIKRMLSDPDDTVTLPRIVVTGIPVATRNKFNWLRVAQSDLDLPSDTAREEPVRELMSLLRNSKNLIATVAGDIHNYQRLELATDLSSKRAAKLGLPPLQLVAGGAGAFLSETHSTELNPDGMLTLDRKGDPHLDKPAVRVDIEPEGHLRFPSREGSFLHYAKRVPSYTRTLAAMVVLSALGMVLATRALWGVAAVTPYDPVVPAGWLIAGPWMVIALVAAEIAVGRLFKPRPHGWGRRAHVTTQVLVPVGTAIVLVCCGQANVLVGILLATAVVLFMLSAQLLPAIFQYLPSLRRSWVLWGVLVLVTVLLARADPTLRRPALFVLCLVVLIVVLVLGILAYRELARRLTRRSILLEPATTFKARVWSQLIWLFRLLPALLVSASLFVLFVWKPQSVLEAFDVAHPDYLAQVGRVLFWSTLAALSIGVCAAAGLAPLGKARRAAPRLLWAVMAAFALALGALACCLLEWESCPVVIWNVFVVASVAGVAGLVGVLTVLFMALLNQLDPPPVDAVQAFLRNRDGADVDVPRSTSLLATVLIGSIRNIESLSEAATPPFAKSILVVRPHGPNAVDFLAYGINDESPAKTPRGPLPETPPDDSTPGGPEHGCFLLDHVRVHIGTRQVERVAHWSPLSSHVPAQSANEPTT